MSAGFTTWAAYVSANPGQGLEQIRVHSAADLFDMMSDAEIDELTADIAKNGLQQPIAWCKAAGADLLLDGRNRIAAIARIQDRPRRDRLLEEVQRSHVSYGGEDYIGYVCSANLHRRHLTAEKRRELIDLRLRADPRKSDRSIATEVRSNRTTVGQRRRALEKIGEVSIIDTRTDTKGRQQPASKPKPASGQQHQHQSENRKPAQPSPREPITGSPAGRIQNATLNAYTALRVIDAANLEAARRALDEIQIVQVLEWLDGAFTRLEWLRKWLDTRPKPSAVQEAIAKVESIDVNNLTSSDRQKLDADLLALRTLTRRVSTAAHKSTGPQPAPVVAGIAKV